MEHRQTEQAVESAKIRHRTWIPLEAGNLTTGGATAYILCCLLYYITRRKSTQSGPSPRKLRHEHLCILSSSFVLVRTFCENIGIFATTDSWCLAYKVTYTLTYHLSMIPLYLLLWKRQRKLYRQKTIQKLISPLFQCVSCVIFVAYACFSVTSAGFYLYMFKVKASPNGCIHDPGMFNSDLEETPYSKKKSFLIASVAIFFSVGIPLFQVIFLLLFLNPLMKQYNIAAFCFRIKSLKRTSKAILRVMKRCSLCTAVCVFSDLALFGCYSLVYNDVFSVNAWSLLVNFNGTMHNLVVILSFKHRYQILLPWRKSKTFKRTLCKNWEQVPMRGIVGSDASNQQAATSLNSRHEVPVLTNHESC